MKRLLGIILCCLAFTAQAQQLRLGYFVGDTQTSAISRALAQLQQERPDLAERLELVVVSQAQIDEVDAETLERVDVLVLSTHEQAAIDAWNRRHETDLIAAVQRHGRVFGIGDGVLPAERYTERGVLWDEQLRSYFEYGGADNSYAMLKYVLHEMGVTGLELADPQPAMNSGYYYPDAAGGRVFATWEEFASWRKLQGGERPGAVRIAVSFYSSYYYSGNMAVIDAVIGAAEQRGAEVIPFFGYPDEAAYQQLLLAADGSSRADVALAFSLRFAQPATSELLAQHDIPVINLITLYGRSAEQWRGSREGLTPFEGTFQIATPELGGLVAPTVVGSLEREIDSETGLGIVTNKPVVDQIDKAIGRALAYARLRQKSNADKKIAILYYNYPPGRAGIGASYLNVAESIASVLRHLQASDFSIDANMSLDADSVLQAMTSKAYNVASYAPGELQQMLANGDAVRIPQQQYRQWLDAMPAPLRDKILQDWGDPATARLMTEPGDDGASFIVPRIEYGNVIILPQPVRGWGEDHEKMYHAKDLAPHHQYVATYEWLKREFNADAVIHMGTHGTLEWLDGKDSGLSGEDAPDALIGELPNLYIYNVDVVGEGLVARRRGAAALVDHMTPPFTRGGTYGEFSALNELIKDYQINENKNPELTAVYAGKIRDAALSLGIAKTLSLELDATKPAQLPDAAMVARIQDHLLELQAQNIPYGLHTFGQLPPAEQIASTVASVVGADRSLLPDGAAVLSEEMTNRIERSAPRELENLTRGIAGRYLPGGNGGEPIRNPDAYPTGKNFYGIDPDKVPKKASWDLGVQLADQMLAGHVKEHGRYPEKISFVIWGGETMRHEGVMESQILHLLGTRPVWNSRDKVVDIEVIPAAQLGRPRVDIVIASAAEGMFSNITQLIDKAVQSVKALEEAENYVRQHYLDTRASLIAKGYPEDRAERMAGVRIFDEPPGIYNLNTARIAESSGTWDSDLGMANDYLKKMGHGYGNGFWGEPMEDAFRLTLSGTEKVVHSNSTSLYGALDNDDFYMYMGGLATAVRSLDGTSPELMVTNTRNPAQPEMTNIDEFIGLEFRSRYVNPRWIEGMQAEGYAGANEMTKFIEYLWGWDATVTEVVNDAMWQEAFEVYVEDKLGMNMQEFFDDNSPYAYQEVTARMLETIRKDYWQADQQTETTLLREYLESVQQHGAACSDHTCGNPRLLEFVVQQAEAAGLPAPLIANFRQQMEAATGGNIEELARAAEQFVAQNEARLERREQVADGGMAPQQVQGYAMEKIESQVSATEQNSPTPVSRDTELLLYIGIVIVLLVWRQRRRAPLEHP